MLRDSFSEPVVRKHILMFKSDWDLIEENYLKRGVSASYFIRMAIRRVLKELDNNTANVAQRLPQLPDNFLETEL